MKLKVLVINGSLSGSESNTARIVAALTQKVSSIHEAEIAWLHLAEPDARSLSIDELDERLSWADAFIFATGTYWDSWGSPLQAFLERATEFEGGALWLGKPAATVVTMHSVGGKEVLSRLQGVLTTLGLLIPPMGGMVYSLANHLALAGEKTEFHSDFWQIDDFNVMAHNLVGAAMLTQNARMKWSTWPVDQRDPSRRWF